MAWDRGKAKGRVAMAGLDKWFYVVVSDHGEKMIALEPEADDVFFPSLKAAMRAINSDQRVPPCTPLEVEGLRGRTSLVIQ